MYKTSNFLTLFETKTSNTSSEITVLVAIKISPVSVSTISLEITLSINDSNGAVIVLTPAVSKIFTCLAVIRRPFSTTISLPDIISNSAIVPRRRDGLTPKSQDFAFILIVELSKKVSRISLLDRPIARNNVVTGSLRRRSIRTYKCS